MTRVLKFDVVAPRRQPRGKPRDVADWITSNQRGPRMSVANKTAKWRTAATEALAEQFRTVPKQFDRRVLIIAKVYKPVDNRYDPMNFYPTGKAVVDAIVAAGILADDDWKHVLGPLMDRGGKCPRGADHLTVTIEEIQ